MKRIIFILVILFALSVKADAKKGSIDYVDYVCWDLSTKNLTVVYFDVPFSLDIERREDCRRLTKSERKIISGREENYVMVDGKLVWK